MAIATTCPNCKARFRLGDDLVGKKVKCQGCAHVFVVPSTAQAAAEPWSVAPPPKPKAAPPAGIGRHSAVVEVRSARDRCHIAQGRGSAAGRGRAEQRRGRTRREEKIVRPAADVEERALASREGGRTVGAGVVTKILK